MQKSYEQGKNLRKSHFAFGYQNPFTGAQTDYAASFPKSDIVYERAKSLSESFDARKKNIKIGNERDRPDYTSL